jgi:hypothetical protein
MPLAARAVGAVIAMAAVVNAAVEPMFESPEAPCTTGKTTICVSQFAPEGTILVDPTNYFNMLLYKDCEQIDICTAWWNSASTPSDPIAYTKTAIENIFPSWFKGWNRGVTIPGYGSHDAWQGGQYMWRAGSCSQFRLSLATKCTFRVPPTSAPTTARPTTPTSAPTKQPTTANPTTAAPTTSAPVTPAPTTSQPTTPTSTPTKQPTTAAPTTPAPVTGSPTTPAPVTGSPTTPAPITPGSKTSAPTPKTSAPASTTGAPTPTSPPPGSCSCHSASPVATDLWCEQTACDQVYIEGGFCRLDCASAPTRAPSTLPPTTLTPVTGSPTTPAPVTGSPVTGSPTTSAPVTGSPVTGSPTTSAPVTGSPVTGSPTTSAPVTPAPVTPAPTSQLAPSSQPTSMTPSQSLQPAAEGKCADVLDAATCNYQRRCSWNGKLRPGARCVQHANQCNKFGSAAGCRRYSSECKWVPRAKAGTRCQLQTGVAVSPLIVLSAPTPAPTLAPTRTSCSYAVDATDCNKQPVCVWRPKNKLADRCAQLPNQCAKLSGTTCQNHPDCDWQPKSKKCNLKASPSIATTNLTPKPTAAPK